MLVYQTWIVVSTGSEDEVVSLTAFELLNIWWHDLTLDMCQLVARLDLWDIPTHDGSAGRSKLPIWALGFGEKWGKMCTEVSLKFTDVGVHTSFTALPGDARPRETPTGTPPPLGT